MLWFACVALVVLAGFFVLTPLFREPKRNLDIELLTETEPDHLLNRKAVVDGNLKELEFEYKMGRLSDADFQQLGAAYKNEAASILQRVDRLDAPENPDETIEKDIALRKSTLYGAGAQEARDSSSCPSCGAQIIPGKKFCADCGCRF
jgi:hypothetical protein